MRHTILTIAIGVIVGLAFLPVSYADNALDKLGRGVTNVTTGWLDLVMEMGEATDRRGHLAGAFAAPVKGIAQTIGRTLVGAYEVTTFLLPPYETIIHPEFVWERDERLG